MASILPSRNSIQTAKNPVDEVLLIQKRILLPEALHITNMLKNCISQVEIAASLPSVLQINEVGNILHEELRELLEKHEMLAEKVETFQGVNLDAREELQEEADETERKAKTQLDKNTKNSVRDILRFLEIHPDVMFDLKLELGKRKKGESEGILVKSLKVFHSHVLEKLLSRPDEKPIPLSDDQTLSSLAEQLKQIIQQEEAITATKLSEKNSEIQDLQNTQQRIDGPEVASAFVEKQVKLLIQTHMQKQTSMQQESDQLNAKLYRLMLENRDAERMLQEKNEKVEMEIEYLLQKFDSDMDEIQASLELNEQIYGQEQEEVRKLEEPFATLEKEYNQILERRQLAEEKRQEELRELELKAKAALYAQAWWRGYSTRKALKNKSKNKKAKKGKGKKER